MGEGLSDSRFNMWRAVVALAHLDDYIAVEEQDFIGRYLQNVPFDEEQKAVLLNELAEGGDVKEFFDQITEPSDQSDFFEFARMICWCDGDYDAQEEKIFEYLKGVQMHRVNEGAMYNLVRETRRSERLVRAQEDEEFEKTAEGLLSLGAIIRRLTS